MITANLNFGIVLRHGYGKKTDVMENWHDVLLTAEITGPDDERQPTFEEIKEILVQIAIKMTNPENLDAFARDLSGMPPETRLKRVK